MTDLDYILHAEKFFAPKVERIVSEIAEIAREAWGDHAAKFIWNTKLSYDLKGQCAGKASVIKGVRLNARLMYHNESFFDETIHHEYAHMIDFYLRGTSNHGRHWKRIMHTLGVTPERCHDFKGVKKARIVKRFTYHCDCREIELTSIRHNKIRKGRMQYRCPLCSGRVVEGPLAA